jgi:hypothetical protein
VLNPDLIEMLCECRLENRWGQVLMQLLAPTDQSLKHAVLRLDELDHGQIGSQLGG